MTPILSYDTYCDGLARSITDKCWWIDKLDDTIDTVVDLGCGEGSVIQMVGETCRFRRLIGVEPNDELRRRASDKNPDAEFVKNLGELYSIPQIDGGVAVCVINSVCHEILTYEGAIAFHNLLLELDKIGFKYIAIRDMCMPDRGFDRMDLFSNDNLPKWIMEEWIDFRIEWEKNPIYRNYTYKQALLEFLLKYNYRDNWEREKAERYLWYWHNSAEVYLGADYYIDYNSTFSIPQQQRRIRRDFGVDVAQLHTHRKMLFTRK